MVKKLNYYEKSFDQVIITTHYGQPHIFIAFFTPIEPEIYQKMIANQKSIFNSRINSLGKIKFKEIKKKDFCLRNTLIINHKGMSNREIPYLDRVFISNRFHPPEIAFELFKTNDPLIYKNVCLPSQKKAE